MQWPPARSPPPRFRQFQGPDLSASAKSKERFSLTAITGKGFEGAMWPSLRLPEGRQASITGNGVAEGIRQTTAPSGGAELPGRVSPLNCCRRAPRHPVSICVQGTVYRKLLNTKGNEFTVKILASSRLSLRRTATFRLQLTPTEAKPGGDAR